VSGDIELVLFTTGSSAEQVRAALDAGIRSFIVDWEWRDKEERQRGADTEINRDGPDALELLRRLGAPRRSCRLNRSGAWTAGEVETAIAAGATDLFLPMVQRPSEAADLLALAAGRCRAGVLVETAEGVAAAPELARLPLDQVYVGLNDLAISRGSSQIFLAVTDGTVAALRRAFAPRRFGFGGLTVVDGGAPVPCRLLLAEMVRLDCDFTFLRRSFRRDVRGRDMAAELTRIHALARQLRQRCPSEVEADQAALTAAVSAVSGIFA
jgi:hypothetical protein